MPRLRGKQKPKLEQIGPALLPVVALTAVPWINPAPQPLEGRPLSMALNLFDSLVSSPSPGAALGEASAANSGDFDGAYDDAFDGDNEMEEAGYSTVAQATKRKSYSYRERAPTPPSPPTLRNVATVGPVNEAGEVYHILEPDDSDPVEPNLYAVPQKGTGSGKKKESLENQDEDASTLDRTQQDVRLAMQAVHDMPVEDTMMRLSESRQTHGSHPGSFSGQGTMIPGHLHEDSEEDNEEPPPLPPPPMEFSSEAETLSEQGSKMEVVLSHASEAEALPEQGSKREVALSHASEAEAPLEYASKVEVIPQHALEVEMVPGHPPSIEVAQPHASEMKVSQKLSPRIREAPPHASEVKVSQKYSPRIRETPPHASEVKVSQKHSPRIRETPPHASEVKVSQKHFPRIRETPPHASEMKVPQKHSPKIEVTPHHAPKLNTAPTQPSKTGMTPYRASAMEPPPDDSSEEEAEAEHQAEVEEAAYVVLKQEAQRPRSAGSGGMSSLHTATPRDAPSPSSRHSAVPHDALSMSSQHNVPPRDALSVSSQHSAVPPDAPSLSSQHSTVPHKALAVLPRHSTTPRDVPSVVSRHSATPHHAPPLPIQKEGVGAKKEKQLAHEEMVIEKKVAGAVKAEGGSGSGGASSRHSGTLQDAPPLSSRPSATPRDAPSLSLQMEVERAKEKNQHLHQEVTSLRKMAVTIRSGEEKGGQSKRQDHVVEELKSENEMLKNAVGRLNQELSHYQATFRPLSQDDHSQLQGLPRKGPVPAWLINKRYLAPLFLAYDDQIQEKEKVIRRCQAELQTLKNRTEEVVRENQRHQLNGRIDGTASMGVICASDWQQLQEQAQLVLEENQVLTEQLDLQHSKVKDLCSTHMQEVSRLTRKLTSSEQEKEEMERELEETMSKLREVKQKYDRMQLEAVKNLAVQDHIHSVADLHRSVIDEKEQFEREKQSMVNKLIASDEERKRKTLAAIEAEAENKRLRTELNTLQKSVRRSEGKLLLLQKAIRQSESKELVTQNELANVIKIVEKTALERDTAFRVAKEQQRDCKDTVNRIVGSNVVMGKMEEKLKMYKLRASAKLQTVSERLKEQDDLFNRQRQEYEREICYLCSLVKEKDERIEQLKGEKRDAEENLEMVWQAAHTENQQLKDTLTSSVHKLRQHPALNAALTEEDALQKLLHFSD